MNHQVMIARFPSSHSKPYKDSGVSTVIVTFPMEMPIFLSGWWLTKTTLKNDEFRQLG